MKTNVPTTTSTNKDINLRSSAWEVGKQYLIRTVTLYQVGKLVYIDDKELVLSSASWIADTGRFHDCLKKFTFNEVEPFLNDVIIGRGSIVDATEWTGELPKVQK